MLLCGSLLCELNKKQLTGFKPLITMILSLKNSFIKKEFKPRITQINTNSQYQ